MGLVYVCDECFVWKASLYTEAERGELRVAPDGRWLCEDHWSEDLVGEWDSAPIPPSLFELLRIESKKNA